MITAAFVSFALLVVAWFLLPSPRSLATAELLDLEQPEPEHLAA